MNNNASYQINLLPATLKDYPVVQNMARFYLYDLSRDCGLNSKEWAMPKDGLYESFDFKIYFEDPTRKAYLIKVNDELAGFVLLNSDCTYSESKWNLGEFFIIARFQGKGVGKEIAQKIFKTHPGKWEISVIPENTNALHFWKKSIESFTDKKYTEEVKTVEYDIDQPERILLRFDTTLIKIP